MGVSLLKTQTQATTTGVLGRIQPQHLPLVRMYKAFAQHPPLLRSLEVWPIQAAWMSEASLTFRAVGRKDIHSIRPVPLELWKDFG